MSVESLVVQFLQAMATSSVAALYCAIFCARYLVFIDILLLAWAWRQGSEGKHAVKESLWAAGVAIVLTTILSWLVMRPRPFAAFDVVQHLIPEPWNMSFPSGHTSVSFAVAAILLSYDKNLGSMAFAIATFVAFGRVAVGVHYPSDIIGGLVVAAIAFFSVKKVHQEVWGKQKPV